MVAKKKKEEFNVEKIIDSKTKGNKKEYLVKWKGYGAKDNTWEPASNLTNVQDMIDAYEKKNSPAPKPAAKSSVKAAPSKKAEPKVEAKSSRAKRSAPEEAPAPAAKKAKSSPAPAPKPGMKASPSINFKKLGSFLKGAIEKKPSMPVKEKVTAADKAKAKEKEQAAKEKEKAKEKAAKEKAKAKQKAAKEKAKEKAKAEKEKAKAAKEAAKKKKKEGEVVEVSKILGVRARKAGVQYKIEWKDGSVSWEPEDNIMDDDLIDDFEESEQTKVYGGATLSVGTEVEVKNTMEGFGNSWSAAIIKKKEKKDTYMVEYTGFLDEKDKPLSESGLPRKRLRLVPSDAPKSWEPIVGEIVEVNEDDCWWEARVEALLAKGKASLKFRVSDEIKPVTLNKKVRPCSWLMMGK